MYKNFTKKLGVPKRYVHNLLRIMRLTTIILIATFMQVSAAGFAQRVTLNEHNASLENVLKEIRQQTGYDMIFDRQLVLKANPVNISVKDVSVDDALEKIIANQSLVFSIEDKTITIKEKVPTLFDKLKKALTPPTDIIGRVTNTHGQPLNGATVSIKRTQSGTLTDANGNFTVRQVLPTDTLVISYLGYKRAFVRIGEQKDLKITLEEATNQLDQVVIQAYGETSQRLTTGNIGKVTAAQIARQPVMNVLEALQGQVPGVIVTNVSGYASGTVKLEIRGRNSIGDFPSDPLYIIDGVPLTILNISKTDGYDKGSAGAIQSGLGSPASGQSPFFNINPNDIESIEILKDADATAIYGSRGSNGVVLVTTKKGKPHKTQGELSVNEGISKVPTYYQMLNTQQYVAMRKEALRNDGLPIDINNAADLVAWDTTRYTDWQKYLWGGFGKSTDAEGSVSGGDDRTTFRIGAGYHRLTEILTSSGADQRGSLSFNINHRSSDQRFSLTASGSYSLTSNNTIYVPGSVSLSPNAPAILDGQGNLNYAGWSPLDGNFPAASLLVPYTSKTNLLNFNLLLNYQLLKGLQLRTSVGYNNIQTNQSIFTTIASQDPISNPTGRSTFGYTFLHNIITEPQLEYNSFISKGKINVLLGSSLQSSSATSAIIGGNGYDNDALITSVNAAKVRVAANSSGEYKYAALFARINYDWENKYIINLNARRDGSSRFGPGKQYGNFGSVGAAWIFSEENWAKKSLSFLSFGKLRSSYGLTGSDQIGNYSYLSLWSFGQDTYNNTLPLTPQGHTDSTLHWQTTRKLEIAIDAGFFKDRLTVSASWYRNECNDQLVPFPTPIFTGFSSVTSNSPADVENSGFELLLSGKIVDSKKLRWSANFNIGFNRNKLLSYPNLAQSPYASAFVVGQSLNIVKVLHNTGVDPLTGLYTFEDKNHDGQITVDKSGKTDDDRYVIDLSPKFDGGFTNNLSYKNWDLSIFWYFRVQKGRNALASLNPPGDNTNQPVSVLNRWQKPGDITSTAKFTTEPYNDNSFINYYQNSDAVYTNASFIRLQNLSVSYTFSKKSNTLSPGSCKVYLQAENLFLISSYKGLDPEVQDFSVFPRARVITAGISYQF